MCTQRYQSQTAKYSHRQSSDESETKSDRDWNNNEGVSVQDNFNKSKQVEIEISFKHSAKQSNKKQFKVSYDYLIPIFLWWQVLK